MRTNLFLILAIAILVFGILLVFGLAFFATWLFATLPSSMDGSLRIQKLPTVSSTKIDSTDLQGAKVFIMNEFLHENLSVTIDYDTSFDLTYDNNKDYIIGYYGQSGTGIKNGIAVYLYDGQQKKYVLNEQLSGIHNPTFYIGRKKITEFYIGNGGGSGSRLEWINGKWIKTKEFTVVNDGNNTIWKIDYPFKGEKENFIRPFQMIPPADILETNIVF